METENNINEVIVETQKSPLHCVTPLSKYIAMILFIALPFIGGWVGYTYAPEKVVEVEKIVEKVINTENVATLDKEPQLPVISFVPSGRFDMEFEGQNEKTLIMSRLINPYKAYYSDTYHKIPDEQQPVSVLVESPQSVGESYTITVISKNGTGGGWLYGSRGESYEYWKPSCYGGCELSPKYQEEFPLNVE